MANGKPNGKAPAGAPKSKLAEDAQKSSLNLFYVVEEGNELNKIVHSGPRFGQFVFPLSLGIAGFFAYRGFKKVREKNEELIFRELDLEEYDAILDVMEEEEEGNPSPYVIQSVLLSTDRFNKREAKKWMRDHGFQAIGEPDKKINFWHFRQEDPAKFDRNSYVTLEINEDIKFLRGIPR